MTEHKIVRAGVGRKFQTPSIYENLTVLRESGDFVSERPQRFRLRSLFRAHCDVLERINEVAEEIFLAGLSAHRRRVPQSRPETMAGDRHAADAGPGTDDAG